MSRAAARAPAEMSPVRQRAAEFVAIVEAAQDAILAKDLDGIITSWNGGAERLYGWSAQEAVGRHISLIVPVGLEGEDASLLNRVARDETIPGFETQRIAKDGSVRHVSLTLSPMHSGEAVVGAAAIARDIGDQKRAEEALRRSESRYRMLLDHLPDASVMFFGPDARIILAAGRLLVTTEWSPAQINGKRLSEILPTHMEVLDAACERVLEGDPQSFEIPGTRVPGLVLSYDMVPVHDESDAVIGGMVLMRDVSQQKKDEDELRSARELFEGAFENAPVGMAMLDAQEQSGSFIRVNAAFADMLGRRQEDLTGLSFSDVTHPDDIPTTKAGLERILRGEMLEDERLKRYVRTDGSIAWGYLRATLVRGADGAPRYALGVVADITSRVEAEKEQARLEILLRQSQKLEGIGRLAGGIAHDFNNLLAVILNYAELGATDAEGDVAEAFAEISRAGERAADLTTTLLVFSKQKVAKPVPLGVNDLVDEMENFLLRTIGSDVELSTSLDPQAPVVWCDKVQLEQALMNLAVNARDAMPQGGRLLIETRSVDLRDTELRGVPGLASGRCAEIRVTDTGTGMPPETLDRVFEPFFTTKEVRHGTGLGLAMVYGTARAAGGTVLVESEEGVGTTVRMLFPRSDEAASSEVEQAAELRPPRGALNLLVVEDEDGVRRVLDRILTRHGHEVLTAAHPDEALELVNDGASIDMLITDVVMPGMSGPQLAARLTELQPGLPVLFISGYTDSPGELPAGATLLRKPFTSAALLREVAAGGSPPSP
jgi:two-component system, cell cycle sensor histidine kinase and response regulator CckA